MDKNILLKSKNGDIKATSELLQQFEPAVYKYSLKMNLRGFDKNDLYQEGSISIMKAISKLDSNMSSAHCDLYVLNTIRNNFANLARKHIKNNAESSLNILTTDNEEILDFLTDDSNLENEIINKQMINSLRQALKTLTKEELELIYIVFYENKGKLSPYILEKSISRYEARKRLNIILEKLRKFF